MIKEICNYKPKNKDEINDKTYMLELYEIHKEKLYSRFKFFHFTASAVVFNANYDKVLFVYHKIYDSWAWMGGHMDGMQDFLEVAKKEVKEESGLKDIKPVFKHPVSIEVLSVAEHYKNGEVVSPHQHLNVTYAFIGNEEDELRVNYDETKGVKWIKISELENYVDEERMLKIYNKIIERVVK